MWQKMLKLLTVCIPENMAYFLAPAQHTIHRDKTKSALKCVQAAPKLVLWALPYIGHSIASV